MKTSNKYWLNFGKGEGGGGVMRQIVFELKNRRHDSA